MECQDEYSEIREGGELNIMKLLVQPGDGVAPLIKGIAGAKQSINLVIFRFDQREVERALAKAVSRGVAVNALIAHTNRAGEENLRRLELRLLAAGVTVARTADDLARYHGKLMIIDRRELYLLAFNYTSLDIDRSRSFGVVTKSRTLVREAVKVFDADMKRQPYEAGFSRFLVSPVNARRELSRFIKGAKKELLIYDPKVSDAQMVQLLGERANAGVEIKIIGRLTRRCAGLEARKLASMRLHTRTIIRDRSHAFVGSQSLREVELDARREVGIIFREAITVSALARIFDEDWGATKERPIAEANPGTRLAKKVAKAIAKDLPPLAPVLNGAVKEVGGVGADGQLNVKEVEVAVRDAVREAVKEAVRGAVEEAVEPEKRRA